MEYVEGETLAQLLGRMANLDPEAITPFGRKDCASYFEVLARAFADVADGLQHAHSRGVVHRDIKPSNLILDPEKRLRILDFGLATLEGQESLTISGDVVGTPLYMSPEQARRKQTSIDNRTDIYSLGATMYEVIGGRPPFRGKDHADTLSQIIDRDPPDPCKFNRRVPKDLETIVLKCLRKDSADRYGTAEALGQDLRRFARADPIEARPQLAAARALRWLKRHRARVLIGGVACALLSTAGALELALRSARHEKELAAYEPAVRAAASKIFASELTVQASGERSGSFTAFGRVKSLMPVAADDMRSLLGIEARRPVEQAARELEAIVARLPGKRDVLFHLARAYSLLERKKDASDAITRTLQIDPEFVPAKVLQLDVSRQEPKDVRAALDRLASKYEATDLWQKWWLLAHKHARVKRWREAARAHAELVALRQIDREPYIGSSIDLFMNQGLVLMGTGDYVAAQAAFTAARTVSPRSVEPTLFLAKAYHRWGDRERGEALLRGLLTRVSDDRKREIALWVTALYNSINDYDRALDWIDDIGDDNVTGRLRVYFLLRLGQTEEAIRHGRMLASDSRDPIAHFVLAQALFEDLGSLSFPEIARALNRALELDKDFAAARELLEIAEAERDQAMSGRKTLITAFALTVAGANSQSQAQQGSFDDVRRMDEVNSPFQDWDALLSPNRLELFISTERAGRGWFDIWVAKRSTPDERFGEPVLVSELQPNVARIGLEAWSMSPDGLTIYFDSDQGGGDSDLYMATRPDLDSPFGEPTRIPGVNTEVEEWLPSLTADGLEIYFTRTDRPSGWTFRRTFVATRRDTKEEFGEAVPMHGIPEKTEGPSITPDGLTLFFQAGARLGQIYMATRSRRWDERGERVPFGNVVDLGWPVNTDLENTAASIDPTWPAPGSKLIFGRCNPGCSNVDLYEATWYPAGPIFRRGDCDANGLLDINDPVANLFFQFVGTFEPPCEDALDFDDSGKIDVTDPIGNLTHQFLGGPPPSSPGQAACGVDPTDDGLNCESFALCDAKR